MKKLLFLALGLFASGAFANIIITGTRVIYPADQKQVNVQLTNQSELPALMQAWVDGGDEQSSPTSLSATEVPFIIVPSVSRMEANAGQTLRMSYTGKKTLPQDRESIFYLNVLDIPPKPKAKPDGNNNYLQIAVRSRIKLFYRPALSVNQLEAFHSVQWKRDGKYLVVNNPSPYFITFSAVSVGQKRVKEVGMIAPFSQKKVLANVSVGQKVQWTAINDYGSDSTGDALIQ